MTSTDATTELSTGRHVLDPQATTVAVTTRHLFRTGTVEGTFDATSIFTCV